MSCESLINSEANVMGSKTHLRPLVDDGGFEVLSDTDDLEQSLSMNLLLISDSVLINRLIS